MLDDEETDLKRGTIHPFSWEPIPGELTLKALLHTYIKYVTYTSYVAPMMTTNSAVNIKPRGELRVDASQCPNIRLEVNSCPSEKSSHVRRKVKVTMHQKRGTKEKCNIKSRGSAAGKFSFYFFLTKYQIESNFRSPRKRRNCKCVVGRLQ